MEIHFKCFNNFTLSSLQKICCKIVSILKCDSCIESIMSEPRKHSVKEIRTDGRRTKVQHGLD